MYFKNMQLPLLTQKVQSVEILTEKLKEINKGSESTMSYLKESYRLSKEYKLTIETADAFKERFLESIRSQILLLQMDDILSEDNMFKIFEKHHIDVLLQQRYRTTIPKF